MIPVTSFKGIPVGVLGLGKSGLVAAQALAAGGADVMAWDDGAKTRETAAAQGVRIVDLGAADLGKMHSLVLSPGIPHTYPAPHPVVVKARAAGAEIIGDIELLGRTQPAASYLGITGTNGKSTTTSLIGHILKLAGGKVAVGGNLGTPALSLAALGKGDDYVLEMSSYQLELTSSVRFDTAVLLNITPDHLDRHGGMDGYVAAKKRIFRGQTAPAAAIIGVDDALCRDIHQELVRADTQIVVPISAERRIAGGVYVDERPAHRRHRGPRRAGARDGRARASAGRAQLAERRRRLCRRPPRRGRTRDRDRRHHVISGTGPSPGAHRDDRGSAIRQ